MKTFENGGLVDTTIRRVGDYAKKTPGDMHMEKGGTDGALVLFELYAPEGQLTELLNKKGSTLRTLTSRQLRRFLKKTASSSLKMLPLLIPLQLLVVADHRSL